MGSIETYTPIEVDRYIFPNVAEHAIPAVNPIIVNETDSVIVGYHMKYDTFQNWYNATICSSTQPNRSAEFLIYDGTSGHSRVAMSVWDKNAINYLREYYTKSGIPDGTDCDVDIQSFRNYNNNVRASCAINRLDTKEVITITGETYLNTKFLRNIEVHLQVRPNIGYKYLTINEHTFTWHVRDSDGVKGLYCPTLDNFFPLI